MGDRGQVYICDQYGGIYLYTHSNASSLIRRVAEGMIAGQSRWDDIGYLTRIIFDYMRDAKDFRQEYGFGISRAPADDVWREIVIDVDKQVITIYNYNESKIERWMGSFKRFITVNWRK